jgi:hypothetical protein
MIEITVAAQVGTLFHRLQNIHVSSADVIQFPQTLYRE